MMMHMLHMGGMDVMWDDPNGRSQFNPDGFYEHPLAEKVATEEPETDIAVKILAGNIPRYIEHVTNPHYPRAVPPIISMRRSHSASADSWNVMFETPRTAGDVARIMAEMDHALALHPHLDVPYDQVVDDPATQVDRIIQFLDRSLDRKAMIAAVNPTYRHHQ